jgi:hypothetical protein
VCVCVCVNITKSDGYSISSNLLSPSDDINSVLGIVSLFCLILLLRYSLRWLISYWWWLTISDWNVCKWWWLSYYLFMCNDYDDIVLLIFSTIHYLYSIDDIMKVFSSMMMVIWPLLIVIWWHYSIVYFRNW